MPRERRRIDLGLKKVGILWKFEFQGRFQVTAGRREMWQHQVDDVIRLIGDVQRIRTQAANTESPSLMIEAQELQLRAEALFEELSLCCATKPAS